VAFNTLRSFENPTSYLRKVVYIQTGQHFEIRVGDPFESYASTIGLMKISNHTAIFE